MVVWAFNPREAKDGWVVLFELEASLVYIVGFRPARALVNGSLSLVLSKASKREPSCVVQVASRNIRLAAPVHAGSETFVHTHSVSVIEPFCGKTHKMQLRFNGRFFVVFVFFLFCFLWVWVFCFVLFRKRSTEQY